MSYKHVLVLSLSIIFFLFVVGVFNGKSMFFFWKMFSPKNLKNWGILIKFDWISMLFFFMLSKIVFSVVVFSEFYNSGDKYYYRFINVLELFVMSMMFLMFSGKILMSLIGWDGLGFSSFILIMYYNKFNSWEAGLKTYLMNRWGDGLLMIFCLLCYSQGHWKIISFDNKIPLIFVMMLLKGLITKSAQFPYSSWLPYAMAAPTPVSALVHSSTLVTAGIYLLMRISQYLSEVVLEIMGVLGLYTLFMASFSACVEWDLKKIMAYSTLSQLGLMCFSLSCGLSLFCFFHLLTHAVFKAVLFMTAGYILGKFWHSQDMRKLSKSKSFKPLIDVAFLVSLYALSGFPFFSGFFSKDLVMEKKMEILKICLMGFFWFSLLLTVVYSFRVLYYLYCSKKTKESIYVELKSLKLFSLILLLLKSIILGMMKNVLFSKYFLLTTSLKLMITCTVFISLMAVNSWSLMSKSLWSFTKMGFLVPNNSFLPQLLVTKIGKEFFFFEQGVTKNFVNIYSMFGWVMKIFKNSLVKMFSNLSLQLLVVSSGMFFF